MSPRTRFRLRALGLFGFLLGCFGVFLLLLHTSGARSPLSTGRTIQVTLPDASNLATKSDVRMGGVRIGQVEKVRPLGDNAVAELRLDDDAGPIYRNARAQLRYKSALNEGYVDLVRGGGRETRQVPDGGILPLSAAEESVKVDQVLSTLNPQTRRSLQGTLDGLAGGLRRGGQGLHDLFSGLSETVDRGTPLFSTLASNRADTGRLVDQVGQIADALGERDVALRTLSTRARDISEVVAARDDRVRETLSELPPTLAQARGTAGRLGGLSHTATPVLGTLGGALDDLAPAIRRLRPAAVQARGAVAQLARFIPKGDPLLDRLRPFADAAGNLTYPLDQTMRQLNPLDAYLSTQSRNIATFFATYTDATQSTDATGHVNSLSFLFNKEALAADLPPSGLKALQALEDAGILSAIGGKIDRNPYPQDGDIAHPKPFTGRYQRVEELQPLLAKPPGFK